MSDPIYELEEISQIYGQESYLAVKSKVNNKAYFANRIEEVGIINFGAILAGERKRFYFKNQGVNSPVMLRSVYAFSSNITNDEIKFYIYYKDSNDADILVASQKFTNNEMPKSFPYGAIFLPDQIIEVAPRNDVDNLIVYCSPVLILFNAFV